jgi:hypothetical protein
MPSMRPGGGAAEFSEEAATARVRRRRVRGSLAVVFMIVISRS